MNGTAHHTIHHSEFNYNYGQYFTLWDRIGRSYKYPEEEYEKHMVWHRAEMKKEIEEMNKALRNKKTVQENGHLNGANGHATIMSNGDTHHDRSNDGPRNGRVNGEYSTSAATTPLRRSARRRE